jgi:hypothetical protein
VMDIVTPRIQGLGGVHSLVWFVTQLQPVVLQITTS